MILQGVGPSVTVVFWSNLGCWSDGSPGLAWRHWVEGDGCSAEGCDLSLCWKCPRFRVSVGRDGWILLAGRFWPGKKWMLLRGHSFFKAFVFLFDLQILNQVNGLDDVSFSNIVGDLWWLNKRMCFFFKWRVNNQWALQLNSCDLPAGPGHLLKKPLRPWCCALSSLEEAHF